MRIPTVVEAVQQAAAQGLSFGAPTAAEVELARNAVRARARPRASAAGELGNGGDDERDPARARLHGPRRIVKFEGCYHGHADALLVKAGSGALTLGNPSSAGVPPATAAAHAGARIQQHRDARSGVRRARRQDRRVIVEPVAGNMNLVAPRPRISRERCARCARATAQC